MLKAKGLTRRDFGEAFTRISHLQLFSVSVKVTENLILILLFGSLFIAQLRPEFVWRSLRNQQPN
ncbi:hypothetical protein BP00DRAFT_423835 [Aspergillus indologenus CBS 114.80]|uniref:Uncharacterized protein n=1 Tax=Aspergillus indologenus CBS 114.80 TaxID=1450541 RepID=A0A2V5IXQ4_9EURO|nr:hypothetical protein BP00DRAFT_423835 [Aspergillus indologenus CBS 114.80]